MSRYFRYAWIPLLLLALMGGLFYIASLQQQWHNRIQVLPQRTASGSNWMFNSGKPVLRVGGDSNYPPYSFIKDGVPTGLDVEMIRSAAEAVGMEVEIRLGPWSEMRQALQQGKVDVLAGMAYSDERDLLFDFTTPHAVVSFDLFVADGSSINSLESVRGKKILVQEGGLMQDYLAQQQITDYIYLVPSPADALYLLSTGKYDVAVLNKVQAMYYLDELGIKNVRAVNADFYTSKYSFALKEERDDLRLLLNQGLSLIKANGRYEEIYDKWLGVYRTDGIIGIFRYLLMALSSVLVLLSVSLIWSWSLKEQVNRRTEDLRKSQEELRKNEARFRLLYQEAPLSYQSLDQHGNVIDANTTWLETLGYTTEDVQGKWFGSFLSPESAERFRALYEQFKEAGFVHGIEFEIKHKNGSKRIGCFDGRISYDSDSHFRQAHCIFRDITEQRQAEQALRQLEDRFEKIFRVSPDLITISRLQDGKYLDANDSFYRYTGYQRQEVIGKTANELAIWVDAKDRLPWVQELREKGQTQSQEMVFRLKDGMLLTGLVSAKIIEVDNEPCILTMARDISERKHAEEKIRRQMEHLAALRAIDIAITTSAGLQETLDVLLDQVIRQLCVDGASVLLYNPADDVLEHGASKGIHQCVLGRAPLAMGEGLAGRAAQSRQMVMVTDVHHAPANGLCLLTMHGQNFNVYYALPLITKNGLKGVMEIFSISSLQPDADWLSFLEALSNQAAIAIENATLLKDLQSVNLEIFQAYDRTIEGWAQALELRDIETQGHSHRVADLMVHLAKEMGIDEHQLVQARRGALLHDVGKMGIPDSILFKPGSLTTEEMAVMQRHVMYGYQFLSPIDFLQEALDIPYCHHEKWDGTGYPRGLKGEEIPLIARIFAVVDVWDALSSDRPYRKSWPKEKVIAYLRDESGKHFDPQVIEVFLNRVIA